MNTQIRAAGIVRESIVDGPGIRFVVFCQGCPHHCEGCHNPDTWPFEGGEWLGVDAMVESIRRNPLLDGVTLSGGEPFAQAGALAELAAQVHELGLNVIAYSGYTFEELLAGFAKHPEWEALLRQIDVLVDGRFELARRNLSLRFRGSENQRILDVPESLEAGRAVPVKASEDWEDLHG